MKKPENPRRKCEAAQSNQDNDTKNIKEDRERHKISGRHNNDGQMAHKGTRSKSNLRHGR